MKHPLPLLLLPFFALVMPSTAQGQEPHYQRMDALHAKKTIAAADIQQKGYADALVLLQYAVSTFEASPAQAIAVLFNGQYLARIMGNGTLPNKDAHNAINSIPLLLIEQLEVAYDPNILIAGHDAIFIGSLNIVAPETAMAPLPIDTALHIPSPMTLRLLALMETEKPKHSGIAKTYPRWGVLAGVQTARGGIVLGVPIEVPLTKQLSMENDWTFGWASKAQYYRDDMGKLNTITNTLSAFEVNLSLKLYLNPRYMRYYIQGGIYLERAMSSIRLGPTNPVLKPVQKAVAGFDLGGGTQFKNGFFVYISLLVLLTRDYTVPLIQRNRGVSVGLGYRFGKP